jgi:hypothetical protein
VPLLSREVRREHSFRLLWRRGGVIHHDDSTVRLSSWVARGGADPYEADPYEADPYEVSFRSHPIPRCQVSVRISIELGWQELASITDTCIEGRFAASRLLHAVASASHAL